MDDNIFYHRTISENLDKGFQVNLVINDFRDVTYIQLRKYFLSYDGEWIPSREGVSVPATMETIYALLDGLLEIRQTVEHKSIGPAISASARDSLSSLRSI